MPAKDKDDHSIESLKQRYDNLNRRKIQTQTQLESTTKQLQELQAEAAEQFGTSDIEELEAKLAEMLAENEKRLTDYKSLLDGIEQDLAKVESETAVKSASVDETK